MTSATKLLLNFKYQLIARMKARNTKTGLRCIISVQLDAQLWRSRKRKRRKRAKRKSP